MPLTARIRVRTYELDSFGHVNNAVYLQYFEVARDQYLQQLGLSFEDFARSNSQFVITEARIRYILSARYGDELEIVGTLQVVGRTSAHFLYQMLRQDGTLIAQGETRGTFLDARTGRPIRMPEPFLSTFGAQARADQAATSALPPALPEP